MDSDRRALQCSRGRRTRRARTSIFRRTRPASPSSARSTRRRRRSRRRASVAASWSATEASSIWRLRSASCSWRRRYEQRTAPSVPAPSVPDPSVSLLCRPSFRDRKRRLANINRNSLFHGGLSSLKLLFGWNTNVKIHNSDHKEFV